MMRYRDMQMLRSCWDLFTERSSTGISMSGSSLFIHFMVSTIFVIQYVSIISVDKLYIYIYIARINPT
jgi:hypothetical protein